MKIEIHLGWRPPGRAGGSSFKRPENQALVDHYVARVRRYVPCDVGGGLPAGGASARRPDDAVWVCDRTRGARALSSEQVAEQLERVARAGRKRLEVWIGGPDGFTPGEMKTLRPDLRWSFGPLTLPHELAAVVAAEQLYRAWTIIRGQPYHLGH